MGTGGWVSLGAGGGSARDNALLHAPVAGVGLSVFPQPRGSSRTCSCPELTPQLPAGRTSRRWTSSAGLGILTGDLV